VSGQRKRGSGSGKEPWPWQQPKPAARTKAATRSSGGSSGGGGGRGTKPTTSRKGPAKPPKSRWRVWLKRLFLTGFVGALLLFVLFAIAYARTSIPDPNKDFQTETTYVYYKDGKTVLGKFATQDRDTIDLQDMGRYTANAAIAA
jgi:hypothetical protein